MFNSPAGGEGASKSDGASCKRAKPAKRKKRLGPELLMKQFKGPPRPPRHMPCLCPACRVCCVVPAVFFCVWLRVAALEGRAFNARRVVGILCVAVIKQCVLAVVGFCLDRCQGQVGPGPCHGQAGPGSARRGGPLACVPSFRVIAPPFPVLLQS